MNTFRNCKVQKILLIKYGVRHYVCLDCAGARGLDFLLSLKTWQLESLPLFRLKERDWLRAVVAETDRRGDKAAEEALPLTRRVQFGEVR